MEVITNEVFRWDVTNDDFIFSGKSYVLEKIMVKINYREEMRRELRTRKRILEWMVLNDIRKADQVSQIVTEYVRPNEILARGRVEVRRHYRVDNMDLTAWQRICNRLLGPFVKKRAP